MAITAAVLQAVCPKLMAPESVVTAMLPALSIGDINNEAREAMWLAQLAHESCEFRVFREVWGPTPQQLRYSTDPALMARLGNINPGDGFRYRGRGPIQLTGRGNYRQYGDELGLPLEQCPEMVEHLQVGFRVAALYWKKHRLNTFADVGDIHHATVAINSGLTGLPQRQVYYLRALRAFAAGRAVA
jgi:putative chitinase